MTDWQTLVDPAALATALGHADLRIVDARFAPATVDDPDFGRRAYAQSHLPGAVYADLNRELSDLSRTGLGRHPLPHDGDFAAAVGRWGITPDSQVVVYDAADGSMALMSLVAKTEWVSLSRSSRIRVWTSLASGVESRRVNRPSSHTARPSQCTSRHRSSR